MGDLPSPSVGDPPSLGVGDLPKQGVGDLPNSAAGGPMRQAWAFLRRWVWMSRRMKLASNRYQGLESGLAGIVPGLAWRLERPAGFRQGPDSAQTAPRVRDLLVPDRGGVPNRRSRDRADEVKARSPQLAL